MHVAADSHCTVGCTATLPVALLPSMWLIRDTFSSLISFQVSSALTKIWLASVFAVLLFSAVHLSLFYLKTSKIGLLWRKAVPRR